MITYREAAYGSDEYQRTLILREEVLRKPIGMVLREKDKALDHAEFHLAAFDGDEMVGCVSLRPLEGSHIKLRQMAVAAGQQGKGIGAGLVRYAESFALEKGFTSIECNARKTAEGFYARLGYEVQSEPFIEVDLYTLKMGKALSDVKA